MSKQSKQMINEAKQQYREYLKDLKELQQITGPLDSIVYNETEFIVGYLLDK